VCRGSRADADVPRAADTLLHIPVRQPSPATSLGFSNRLAHVWGLILRVIEHVEETRLKVRTRQTVTSNQADAGLSLTERASTTSPSRMFAESQLADVRSLGT
jgi:hypothetical protein